MEGTPNVPWIWIRQPKTGKEKRTKRATWMEVHVPDAGGAKNPKADAGGHYHGVRVIVASKKAGDRVYARAMALAKARYASETPG